MLVYCLWGCSPKATETSNVVASPPPQVCCGGEVQPAASPKGPDIAIVDLGNINQGETVRSSFSVKNESAQAVQLSGELEYSLPCCFHPQAQFSELAPGQSGEVSFEFDSKFRPGIIDLFVTVPFSDGKNRQVYLKANVTESFKVWPTGMRFKNKGSKVPLIVSGDDLGSSFEVLEIFNPHPDRLKIEGPVKTERGLEYEGTWIASEQETEIFTLEVRTNHSLVPIFPVSIAPPGAKV